MTTAKLKGREIVLAVYLSIFVYMFQCSAYSTDLILMNELAIDLQYSSVDMAYTKNLSA